jgi:hypothetical protein
MNYSNKKEVSGRAASIISVLFHPLLMPVYGFLIIFSAPTLFGYMPYDIKKLLLMIVIVNNVFLPLSLIPFLMNRKIITTWTVEKREERKVPLILASVLYATSSYIVFRLPIPIFLKSFVYASFFLSIIALIINFWWKISLHSISAGALIALVLILSLRMYTPLVWYLVASVMAGSLVMFSRLRLDYHNPPQVWLGLMSGFAGLFLFMMVI